MSCCMVEVGVDGDGVVVRLQEVFGKVLWDEIHNSPVSFWNLHLAFVV